ncbi:hypothetical protein HK101_010457 [Irineochytrium annulatum]|nr:hypothetical protein HK101_010457 [Irineochytrium annulatum]
MTSKPPPSSQTSGITASPLDSSEISIFTWDTPSPTLLVAVLPAHLSHTPFPSFSRSPHARLLFRSLVSQVRSRRVSDYRINVVPIPSDTAADQPASFKLSVRLPKPDQPKTGPRKFDACLSCDPSIASVAECNYLGGEGGRGPPGGLPDRLRRITTESCDIGNLVTTVGSGTRDRVRFWLDAQARPLLLVTPRRHVGGMEEMNDEEVAALWDGVGAVVGLWGQQNFSKIVLNVGGYRNIEHSHVKIWFDDRQFLASQSRWPAPLLEVWRDLHELRRLMKLPDPAALRKLLEASPGPAEITVRGQFDGAADESELSSRFGAFGGVTDVKVGEAVPEKIKEHAGALVVMEDARDAVRAIVELNLRSFGSNVMCKVKLVQEL